MWIGFEDAAICYAVEVVLVSFDKMLKRLSQPQKLRWPVVRSANKADAGKKENAAQGEIDQYFFDILSARAAIHKVNSAQDEPGNPKDCQNNAYNSFLHNSLLSCSCKLYAL